MGPDALSRKAPLERSPGDQVRLTPKRSRFSLPELTIDWGVAPKEEG
jgi:hypothetical protein